MRRRVFSSRTAKQLEAPRECFQILVLGGFDLCPVTEQDRRAQPQRIELPGRLQDARLGSFREHDPLGVALELFDDAADETHGTGFNTGG